MRWRGRLLAGVAALALIAGGATGATLITVPAGPVLALAPVPVRPLRPADVAPFVLARLEALARRSPYADDRAALGKSRRDFVSAWTWSYAGRSAVRLYALTGDDRLIRGLLAAWRQFDAAGHEHARVDGYGWYTTDRVTGVRWRDAPVAGLIVQPIVDLLLEAERSPALAALIAAERTQLLRAVTRGLDGLDTLFVERDGRGVVMNMERRGPEPGNLAAAYAVAAAGHGALRGDPRGAHQLAAVARAFQASLRTVDGRLGWPYFPAPAALAHRPEPVHKSPGTLELVMAAYREGVVFGDEDLAAIAGAFRQTVLIGGASGPEGIRAGLDGGAQALDLTAPKNRHQALQLGAWYGLTCAAPDIGETLDRLLPALDPAYARNLFVISGLTERWLSESDPTRCQPRSKRVAVR
jgi:hypothetical protein